jgi:hypothetical protein
VFWYNDSGIIPRSNPIFWGGAMRIHEYQSKMMFSRYGIPIPNGRVASTASEARQIAEELGVRVVVKAQVLVGGVAKQAEFDWPRRQKKLKS